MRRMQYAVWWLLLAGGRYPIGGLEGFSSPDQLMYLEWVVKRIGARTIGEIGFNTGFSSYAFLRAHPDTTVVSFDLGEHRYTRWAKWFIDRRFPGRHTLIYGDSRVTVPEYMRTGKRFDLVFIDGGHDYEIAKADLTNMTGSGSGTAVVMDDLTPWTDWGSGPAKAWTEAVEGGVIRQDELFKDGKRVDVMAPPGKRSWALGRYA